MSKVPLKASTSPAGSRCPVAASAAARKVTTIPATVTSLGVTPSPTSRAASRWAFRLTHFWNRVVNIRTSSKARRVPRVLINREHLGGDLAPRVALGLAQARLAEPAPVVGVERQHRQRLGELGGALRSDGE